MNEVLAAGMLLASDWDGKTNFWIRCAVVEQVIEAAMIACNIPPESIVRIMPSCIGKTTDAELFEKITESALNKTREFHHKIIGYDKRPRP